MIKKYFKDLRFRLTGDGKYIRKYEVTSDIWLAASKVSPQALLLLNKILERTSAQCNADSVLVVGEYDDFGYDNYRTFQRHRKQLIDAELIRYDGLYHYANPRYIIRKNRVQLQYFMELAGIVKKPEVPHGKNW